MLSEFQLIDRYFKRAPRTGGPVQLGVGDDCALLQPPAGETLAISTDMLVEGRHFFSGTDACALGHKALAVNLSDLAAMGARPLGFTLAMALPAADPDWLELFSSGLMTLADAHHIELIGGDTTRGPLTLSITVFGSVSLAQALRRSGARAGDELWISGTLGDARLALAQLQGDLNQQTALDAESFAAASERLHRPTPRVSLGLALRGIATSAIDISDGLLGDLGHVLDASRLGAIVYAQALPIGIALSRRDRQQQLDFALNGGDDYELCFSAPADRHDAVLAAANSSQTPVSCIGMLRAEPGISLLDDRGLPLSVMSHSFDHFAQR